MRLTRAVRGALLAEYLSSMRPSASICPRCFVRNIQIHHQKRDSPSSKYPLIKRRCQTAEAAAREAAQNFIDNGPPPPTLPGGVQIDPFKTVAKEMKSLSSNMLQLVGSGHPVLNTVASYYAQSEGKHIRPMLVLLMSQATAVMPKASRRDFPDYYPHPAQSSINEPLSPIDVLSDMNPSAPSLTADRPDFVPADGSDILPSQRRLAEITELIHTASLLHDDVIDGASIRRSAASANIAFGNKMAVLAGDFLLGRASVALARLRTPEVTELLATVIANLIEGEFMQLRNTAQDEARPSFKKDLTLEYYLQKTYLKSASLISKSCRAAALLGDATPEVVNSAYEYGRNLGLAFQLIDDLLDYTSTGQEFGKPSGGADLELGLATAPLLFAWREHEELGELVGRKFSKEGDVLKAKELVSNSNGLEQTRLLAQDYADKAVRAIAGFADSDAKSALGEMCLKVMQRRK